MNKESIGHFNDGNESAREIYARGGLREQGGSLNPHPAGTEAAADWARGWTTLWDAQEGGFAAWAAKNFPRGTGTGTDGAGNFTYRATGWFQGNW